MKIPENRFIKIIKGGAVAELTQLRHSYSIIILTFVEAIVFLCLVSLFALTGAMAPTAIVSSDDGAYAEAFIQQLSSTHHSFAIKRMTMDDAQSALKVGKIVAIIAIPSNFSSSIAERKQVRINVQIDNVNIDFTEDIKRALPAAIVAFGNNYGFSGISVQSEKHDLIDHDTGYIDYLVVSGLALDAFIIAAVLAGILLAREFEKKTIRILAYSPVHPLIALSGRALVTWGIAFVAMGLVTAIAIWGFGITPMYPLLLVPLLAVCTLIFMCVGLLIGSLLRKVLPVASVIFGLSIPLYIVSGALEPERFDGHVLWIIGHVFPVYYAVGVFEYIFHGYQVTAEPIYIDFIGLIIWAVLTVWVTIFILKRRIRT